MAAAALYSSCLWVFSKLVLEWLDATGQAGAVGRNRKAIVIGGGVVGVTTAHALARSGWAVRVVDRCAEVAQEASWGNGRQLSYSHATALASPGLVRQMPGLLLGYSDAFRMTLHGREGYLRWLARFLTQCLPAPSKRNTLAILRLAEESRLAMDDLLARHTIEFGRATTGKLIVLTHQREVEAALPILAAKRRAGLAQDLLSPDQAYEIEPALVHSADPISGALYAPGDETGDCHAFTVALMRLTEGRYGARFIGGTKATHLSRLKGKVGIGLESGEFLHSDLVVVASGHAANDMLAPIGYRLPIQPMKGYSFTAPLGTAAPKVSITSGKRRIVFTHCGDRMLVAGLAEMGRVDCRVDPQRLQAMIASARAALPEAALYSEADQGWVGLRPMTPTSQPVIGMVGPGIAVNVGHGMLGWTLAMGAAERLSRAVGEAF